MGQVLKRERRLAVDGLEHVEATPNCGEPKPWFDWFDRSPKRIAPIAVNPAVDIGAQQQPPPIVGYSFID
jgi:hypothetical protein